MSLHHKRLLKLVFFTLENDLKEPYLFFRDVHAQGEDKICTLI